MADVRKLFFLDDNDFEFEDPYANYSHFLI